MARYPRYANVPVPVRLGYRCHFSVRGIGLPDPYSGRAGADCRQRRAVRQDDDHRRIAARERMEMNRNSRYEASQTPTYYQNGR